MDQRNHILESKRQGSALAKLKKLPGETFVVKINTSHNGFPDVMCMVNGKIFFFEFKQPDKKNEKIQAAVHRKIRRCGYIAERVTCFNDCMDIINGEKK